MSVAPGRASRVHPSPTKTVLVYRNGDAFFPGRRFVINPRQVSSFDSFLNTVTRGVEAPFGAVRSVYTPREGHRVQSLETLQHGEKYVAGGTERFKRLDYSHINTKKPQQKKSEVIKPVVHSRIIVPARWRKILHESCAINVFTNGDILVPPARILIPKYTLRNWERVLAMVTEKVHLRTGAVHRLCTLDGTPLSSSLELKNNLYYVATGVERFRLLPYFHWVPRKGILQDNSLGVRGDFLPPVKRQGKHTRDVLQLSSQYVPEGGDSDPAIFSSTLEFADHRLNADSLFYAKSGRTRQQKQASKTPLLLFSGEGSVFKAKARRRETIGAAEIQEDGQMKVDLPIDQVEAKVVEEEQRDAAAARPDSEGQTSCSTVPTSARSKKVSSSVSPDQSTPRAGPTESGRITRTHTPDMEPLKTPAKPEAQNLKNPPTVPAAERAEDRRPSIV